MSCAILNDGRKTSHSRRRSSGAQALSGYVTDYKMAALRFYPDFVIGNRLFLRKRVHRLRVRTGSRSLFVIVAAKNARFSSGSFQKLAMPSFLCFFFLFLWKTGRTGRIAIARNCLIAVKLVCKQDLLAVLAFDAREPAGILR